MTDPICVFVCGRRGFGKTTLVQKLAAPVPRKVAFDPTGEYARALGWARAENVHQVYRHLRQHWAHGFKVALTATGDYVGQLHTLSEFLWAAQQPYETGADRRQLLLIAEEMNLSVPVHNLPATQRGFLRLVLQGRHRGIGIIGVSQRPALVSKDFRSMVAERYTFGLGEPSDATAFPGAYRDVILSLPPHEYLRFGAGQVARLKNSRPRAATGHVAGAGS